MINIKVKHICIFISTVVLIQCSEGTSENNEQLNASTTKTIQLEKFEYDSLTIPLFFKSLIKNRLNSYSLIYKSIKQVATDYQIDSGNTTNLNRFYTLELLHDLFTSETASDCSMGEILNIPYYWHWVEPNPRHTIRFVKTGELLVNTKPPKEYSRYNSFADVDRTPFLFLSDLMGSNAKYASECDTFSTFGWCSEREMAFVCLTSILGFEGKVVVDGGHSWSEFIVPMKGIKSDSVYLHARVDNTFNSIIWEEFEKEKLQEWRKPDPSENFENWCNKTAKSKTETEKIKSFIASNEVLQEIDAKLVKHIEEKLKDLN